MQQLLGIYIHIPFCNGKCPYCDFYSVDFSEDEANFYTQQVCKAIETQAMQFGNRKADTLYFGGGTPSVLGTENLLKLIYTAKKQFQLDFAEITLEVNPSPGLQLDFTKLKEAGVNRVSVGVQTSNTQELRLLGRKHSAQDAQKTVRAVLEGGIENISMDLMLGISGQTKDSLKASIDFCAACGAQHISCYILKIEEGTPYFAQKNKLSLPGEAEQTELYLFMCDNLEKNGFSQYEISNFSKAGFESRHNLKYWNCEEYLGIGPSAHSFIDGKRFFTPANFKDFYNGTVIEDGAGGDEEEYIMLALRLSKGVRYDAFFKKFQKEFPRRYIENAKKYEKGGLVYCDKEGLRFSKNGFLLSNRLTANILWDQL